MISDVILFCKEKIFLSPNILLPLCHTISERYLYQRRLKEGKESRHSGTVSFLYPPKTPTSFGSAPTFFLVFLFYLLIKVLVLEEVLYVVLTSIITFSSKWTLELLVASLHTLKTFPYSSYMACPFFPHFSKPSKGTWTV